MVDDAAALEQAIKDARAALGGGALDKAVSLAAEGEFQLANARWVATSN